MQSGGAQLQDNSAVVARAGPERESFENFNTSPLSSFESLGNVFSLESYKHQNGLNLLTQNSIKYSTNLSYALREHCVGLSDLPGPVWEPGFSNFHIPQEPNAHLHVRARNREASVTRERLGSLKCGCYVQSHRGSEVLMLILFGPFVALYFLC